MDRRKWSPKTKRRVWSIVLVMLIGGVVYGMTHPKTAVEIEKEETEERYVEEREEKDPEESEVSLAYEVSAEPSLIGVHVSGAVKMPDHVYYLPEGSRIEDALAAAGGALEGAALHALNLAAYLEDGEQIYVPTEREVMEYAENQWVSIPEDKTQIQENGGAGTEEEGYLTNLNQATKIELMELPGIGETYAQRIIDYRETNGPFGTIEEIMNVSGIGESKFEKLKDLITVE